MKLNIQTPWPSGLWGDARFAPGRCSRGLVSKARRATGEDAEARNGGSHRDGTGWGVRENVGDGEMFQNGLRRRLGKVIGASSPRARVD